MNSTQRALYAAVDTAVRAIDPTARQHLPGHWRFALSPAWHFALTVSLPGSASRTSVKTAFLLFSEEIQRLMDRILARPHNPDVATLTFTPMWAREFLVEVGQTPGSEAAGLHRLRYAEVSAATVIDELQSLGLPAARKLGSLAGVVALLRDGRLAEVCLPSDYVASCALLLAGNLAEAEAYVAHRLAELSRITSDASLEPFLEFGPRLLADYRHDA